LSTDKVVLSYKNSTTFAKALRGDLSATAELLLQAIAIAVSMLSYVVEHSKSKWQAARQGGTLATFWTARLFHNE